MMIVTATQQFQAAHWTGPDSDDLATLTEWNVDTGALMSNDLWFLRDPIMGVVVSVIDGPTFADQYVEVPTP